MRITLKDFKNRGLARGFFMSAFSVAVVACQTAPDVNPPKPQISGLYIGMPEADLIDKFGEGTKTNTFLAGDYADMSYDGLSVSLMASGPSVDSPKVVSGIWAKDSKHCYADIVCPTMDLASIQGILGPAEIEPATRDKPERVTYPIRELETCWLWIYLNEDRTASDVRLACQP